MKANNNISKLVYGLAVAAGICALAACSDDFTEQSHLTPEQEALIGTGVHFEPYVSGFQTRAFNHDGFNADDVFYICRQALDESTGTWEPEEKWKTYFYKAYVTPAGIIYRYEWVINKKDNAGFRNTTQTDADSIFWENGRQVRFRAYAKSSCCDDYMYADYAYVSGPMGSVPMEFKHLGCRIGFAPYSGNTIGEVEYCTEWEDYMREDNADSHTGADDADKVKTEAEARKIAADVKAVFDRICMPGGLALYSDAGNNWYKRDTETGAETTQEIEKGHPTPQFGQLTAKGLNETTNANGKTTYNEVLAGYVTPENTKRPNWKTNMDGIRYCIMIPYNMRKDSIGQPITIPADTRFRVPIHDVNTGDVELADGIADDKSNGNYHIFSLRDIKVLDPNDPEGKKALVDTETGKEVEKYPNGITLRAGYSYTFYVGYKYNRLVVRVNEECIDWGTEAEKTELEQSATNKNTHEEKFGWWKDEMHRAAYYALDTLNRGHQDKYEPNFIINSMEDWIEFTNIVNGNVTQPIGTDSTECIQYDVFHPSNGMVAKKVTQKYLADPFSFKGMTVTLQCDLDFEDRVITPIGGVTLNGKAASKFCGQFNGAGHTLSNFKGTVFGYVGKENKDDKNNASIKGLYLKSTQRISLVNEANGTTIMGISVEGPSDHAITSKCQNSIINMCCHVGIGDKNGSLLGDATDNTIISSFIAAADKGTLNDETCTLSNSKNLFTASYFDRSLSSGCNWGTNKDYPADVDLYEARGVLSQTLRAVIDKVHGKDDMKPNLDYFYGPAPYKVMNQNKGEAAEKYNYEVQDPNNFYDRYPTLSIKKETGITNPDADAVVSKN